MSTGLNFQTQTIINSKVDHIKKGSWLYRGANEADNILGQKVFRVKRDFTFKERGIGVVRKAEAFEPVMCKATIDFSTLVTAVPSGTISLVSPVRKYGRIDLYIGLEGSESFLYANPWIRKGMPLWVEFYVDNTDKAENVVARIAKDIKKNKNFVIDHELITVKAEGSKLVFEGADEFQRIRNISVYFYNENDDDATAVAKLGDETITLNERGLNGFGTYEFIIRNLRLPTIENTMYSRIRQDETPILGDLYNEYIIEYCDEATNDGTQVVGNKLLSYTTHVFWVNQKVSEDFEAELKKVYPTIDDADEATKEEVAKASSEKITEQKKTKSVLDSGN